jgi:hypothetical protein
MSYDSVSLGASGTARFAGQRGRTADGTARSGVRYPSPFFDIAHTYLPPSMKALLRWCRYYYLVNPLINTVIHKMSEYPVTEIVIDESNAAIREKWEKVLGQHLRYRAFQIECGLDYHTYGIVAVTVHFPFTKYLVCKSCDKKHKATKIQYKWRNLDYIIACDCGVEGPATVLDFYERDVRRIRLMRWNPEYINVDPGFGGADPVYTFELPLQLKNDLILGKKVVLDTVPDIFVEAMRRNKFIRFTEDNVFVMRRPIISQKDNGWGMPLILPVLKDTFYLQVLRKAQEQIAQEHIVPLRVLFPMAGSGTSDPYTTIDLNSWKSRIEGEIAKWKYDNNYIPILPLPIGNETIGGDGKALGLYQEMDVWSKQIVAGMGVPQEFVYGGLQYSGSNVSMRMLENMFIGYRQDHENMLNNFVIRRIANFMQWPVVTAHMKRFKMADDLQRSAFYFQLNQAQKISDQTLLQECDFEPAVEEERKQKEIDRQLSLMRKQQLAQAGIQGEVMLVQARYNAKSQKMMMESQAEMQQNQPGAGVGEGAPGGAGGLDQAAGGQDGQQGGQPGQPGMAGEGAPSQPGSAGLPGMQGQQTPASGAQGEMVDGQQVDPSMPEGTTVSPQNAQQAPGEGVPLTAQSPLQMGQKGGGYNLLYLAKRAANQIQKIEKEQGAMAANMELNRVRMGNPQLGNLVLQIIQQKRGSQADPLSAMQSPQPQQKPSRRPSPTGV